MSGIAGIFSTNHEHLDAKQAVAAMLAAQSHRGPDGSGMLEAGGCILGHNRRVVIDCSKAHHQPMSRADVFLTFDGTLYNALEKRCLLETQGASFTGRSDAEVLLNLYLRYGEGCLEHLRGVYAFAIWDARTKTLLCARDPLGIKPFLYAAAPSGFIFASELKGLLASGLIPREANRDALHIMLQRGSIPQPLTAVKGMRWLLPGHCLLARPGQEPAIRCFKPLHGRPRPNRRPYSELVEQGKHLLESVVKRQMTADVPLGAFLSGGIDSSLLVALMSRERADLHTFSVGFENSLPTASWNEVDEAALVARHLGVLHTQVTVTQEDVLCQLPDIIRALDHPTVDGVNSWFVAQAARKEVGVAISGTGGDELFAGYPWFAAMKSFSRPAWLERLGLRRSTQSFTKAFGEQYLIFDEEAAIRLCPSTEPPFPRPDPLSYMDSLGRVTGMLLSGYTRDQLLADIDAVAMWHGLEVRLPLLDEELLEFALNLPAEAKLGVGDPVAAPGSYAASGVKRILLDIGAPLLPEGFAVRSKRGFTLPFDAWLAGILAPLMRDLLSPATLKRRGFFEPEAVQQVAQDFMAGKAHWTRPWLLMATGLWAEQVLDNTSRDNTSTRQPAFLSASL